MKITRAMEFIAGVLSLASGLVLLDKLSDGWFYDQYRQRTESVRRYLSLAWDAFQGGRQTIEDAEKLTHRPWWQRG